MGSQKERIVIQGNEFYEIDLECEKRKQSGKPCHKASKSPGIIPAENTGRHPKKAK